MLCNNAIHSTTYRSGGFLAKNWLKEKYGFFIDTKLVNLLHREIKNGLIKAKAKRIREICDLTDSVTSAECLKNTLLRMGYEIICTNDISRYNDRYELIPKFDKTYQIKVPFVSREKENMLLARALCEIQTGIHNDMECKIIARRLLMPKQKFLDQIKKNEDVSGRVNITNIARHFCVDESVVSSLGVDLNLLSIF